MAANQAYNLLENRKFHLIRRISKRVFMIHQYNFVVRKIIHLTYVLSKCWCFICWIDLGSVNGNAENQMGVNVSATGMGEGQELATLRTIEENCITSNIPQLPVEVTTTLAIIYFLSKLVLHQSYNFVYFWHSSGQQFFHT